MASALIAAGMRNMLKCVHLKWSSESPSTPFGVEENRLIIYLVIKCSWFILGSSVWFVCMCDWRIEWDVGPVQWQEIAIHLGDGIKSEINIQKWAVSGRLFSEDIWRQLALEATCASIFNGIPALLSGALDRSGVRLFCIRRAAKNSWRNGTHTAMRSRNRRSWFRTEPIHLPVSPIHTSPHRAHANDLYAMILYDAP